LFTQKRTLLNALVTEAQSQFTILFCSL